MSDNPPTADRNLLFGILALQMDFITRDQLGEVVRSRHGQLGGDNVIVPALEINDRTTGKA